MKMGEFVELEEGRWVLRSEIVAFRILSATGHYGVDRPRVMVSLRGEPNEFLFEFDDLDQANAAARKIRGVSQSENTEWADSRIIDPGLTINFRTQESPILWGRWHDRGEGPFRVIRNSDGTLLFDSMLPFPSRHLMDRVVATPDFWRHLPVEEKMEILDRIHKAANEGERVRNR